MGFLHGVRLVFATSTAGFVPDVSGSHAMGRRVQPAHQRRMPRESVRLAGEFGEDRLGDVCRCRRVATDLPNGGRVDQVQVAAHHFLERRFRPVVRVAPEQFGLF